MIISGTLTSLALIFALIAIAIAMTIFFLVHSKVVIGLGTALIYTFTLFVAGALFQRATETPTWLLVVVLLILVLLLLAWPIWRALRWIT